MSIARKSWLNRTKFCPTSWPRAVTNLHPTVISRRRYTSCLRRGVEIAFPVFLSNRLLSLTWSMVMPTYMLRCSYGNYWWTGGVLGRRYLQPAALTFIDSSARDAARWFNLFYLTRFVRQGRGLLALALEPQSQSQSQRLKKPPEAPISYFLTSVGVYLPIYLSVFQYNF